jgi:uncharacterized protein YfdQ (DUF2303 family)
MMDKNVAEILMDAGLAAGEVRTVDKVPFLVTREGLKVHSLEGMLPRPTKKRSTIHLDTLQSYIDFVSKYQDMDTKAFYRINNKSGLRFETVFDFHEEKGDAAWCQDVAIYSPEFNVEWKEWMELDGKSTPQREFAEFLESHAVEIREPSAATMLEVATTLTMKTGVDFGSQVDLRHGNQSIRYTEVTEVNSGKTGDLEVPRRLLLAIAPFPGGPRYEVEALLRIRVQDRKLAFVLKLERPHKVVEAAVQEMVEKFTTLTQVKTFEGFVFARP